MLFNLYLWRNIPRRKVFGSLRVLGYGLVVSFGLGAFTMRNAVADAESQGLKVGRELADVADLLNGANEFRLNNQEIFLNTTTSADNVATVLDRFEAHCNKAPAFDSLEWKTLGDLKGKSLPPSAGVSHIGVVRKVDPTNHDGMVMCFTGGKSSNFFAAARAFQQSGDLADLGNLRYAHVSPRTNGGSFIQAIWTDGHFDTRAIMGEEGKDSIGSDAAGLPRPENSIRKFTAEGVGTPYSARIYQSSDAPEKILADYNAKMDKQGWFIINSPFRDPGEGRWYTRGDTAEQSMISLRREGDHTTVVVGSLGVSDKAPKDVKVPQ